MPSSSPADAWILGLDGGGTQTRVALASAAGMLLGPFSGPGCNPFDQASWRENLTSVLNSSPAGKLNLVHATLGLPGYGETAAVSRAQQMFSARHFRCPVTLLNDVAVAFHGALADHAGVLILAGTGSMAWAADAAGREIRVGGFGHDLGDEGSAFWIGLRALQRLSWILDGRLQNESFRDAFSLLLEVETAAGLLAWFHAVVHRRSGVAALAPLVDQLAAAGDTTARELLLDAARHLSQLAITAQDRLALPAGAAVSLAGGVFNSTLVRNALLNRLSQRLQWHEPELDPLGGALLHAAGQAHWSADVLKHIKHRYVGVSSEGSSFRP